MRFSHRTKINQFVLAHPSTRKAHPLLYGFEDSMPLERVRHDNHFPKPGRRTRQVRRVHLDVDDRIGHLLLLPFPLVFSQLDTFLLSLPVFQESLPLFSHSLRIPWDKEYSGQTLLYKPLSKLKGAVFKVPGNTTLVSMRHFQAANNVTYLVAQTSQQGKLSHIIIPFSGGEVDVKNNRTCADLDAWKGQVFPGTRKRDLSAGPELLAIDYVPLITMLGTEQRLIWDEIRTKVALIDQAGATAQPFSPEDLLAYENKPIEVEQTLQLLACLGLIVQVTSLAGSMRYRRVTRLDRSLWLTQTESE
jgi:hypothetical protein